MNKKTTLFFSLLLLVIFTPFLIGFFLPKEKVIVKKAFIDKMYFFILSDITNHWEEAGWRTNLDTMIQQPQVDGMDAWKEYYTNGDSVFLLTQVSSGTDYVRIILDNDGTERARSITLVDVNGKTAVRMSEEVLTRNPLQRFFNLFDDKVSKRMDKYLLDLVEKNKPQEEDKSEVNQ